MKSKILSIPLLALLVLSGATITTKVQSLSQAGVCTGLNLSQSALYNLGSTFFTYLKGYKKDFLLSQIIENILVKL
jgi:hypothetical protein